MLLAYDAFDTFNSSTVWGASQIVMFNAAMFVLFNNGGNTLLSNWDEP